MNSRGQTIRVGPPAWLLGEVLTAPYRKICPCHEQFHKASDFDCSFGMRKAGFIEDSDSCSAFVNAVMNLRVL